MRELLVLICCVVASGAAPPSIRDVDWKNFSYPLLETKAVPEDVRWMPNGTEETALLVNGRYVVPDNCTDDISSCPLVTFRSVSYGALTGIKSTVAAVVL